MPVLANATVSSLSVPTPTYDRAGLSVGIVHIGFGNFHRAHQAMFLDRLMERGRGLDWAICGVGILPQDATMRDAMRAQDCLYTLTLRHPDGSLEPRVIGSVAEYLFGPEDPGAVYARLTDPGVRIVSLTITEGGYLKNPATGEFAADDPSVRHDLEHPEAPGTAFGYLVEALRRRRDAGIAPFTVLSCDNLQGNGHYARQAVLGFARLRDPGLADWIAGHVTFPNSMVDRIVPVTTDADRVAVRELFGIEDAWPVAGEEWAQWIIEDDFVAGRPELDLVGAQLVTDVRPYELMKLRLLNASHQVLAYFGTPLGYRFVDEAIRDERIAAFLRAYQSIEAVPTLGALPGIDLPAYRTALLERFGNQAMTDTLVRQSTDGSNRMPTFILPTIAANLAAGRPVRFGAAIVAAWAEYWASIGRGELPAELVPADAAAEVLAAAALDPSPTAFLEVDELFGDLGNGASFRDAYLSARASLREHGVHATIDALLAG